MEPTLITQPKLITLAQLVMTHSPAVLAKAVDKHGLYGWDEFGVWGEFKKNTETASFALKKLSEVYYSMVEAARHDPPKSWHGELVGKHLIGPLHHLGWLHGQMPDFKKISDELSRGPVFMPIDSPKMRDMTAYSIIGGMLHMLKEQPARSADSGGVTQSSVIEYLIKKFVGNPGISKSNLEIVFAAANNFIATYTGTEAAKKINSKPKSSKRP